mgnify:CR=1 FL=1
MAETAQQNVALRLGDIIRLKSPSSRHGEHNKVFLVTYISSDRIDLAGEDTTSLQIPIRDGKLVDTDLTGIEILSRSGEAGYARQNGLLPDNWVDIHFGGDVPAVFTGKITDLDEDMIEIQTHPDGHKIYLDFKYQGLPKDLPIDKIVIREPPEDKGTEDDAAREDDEATVHTEGAQGQDKVAIVEGEDDGAADTVEAPIEKVREQLREMLLDADKIQIGEQLEAVTQIVEVPEGQQRFGLEKQTNDLLDELLSTIPNEDRTRSVLNNLHRMIERFKQLRDSFSKFDEQGNAMMPKVQGAGHKPLVDSLLSLDRSLMWLLPVVRSKKKLYNVDVSPTEPQEDFVPLSLAEARLGATGVIGRYVGNDVPEGENKLAYLMNALNPYLTPFEEPNNVDRCLFNKAVNANIACVVDTLEDFYASVASNDVVKRKRFLIQKYNLGLQRLHTEDLKDGGVATKTVSLTQNDTACVTGLLTLPEPAARFSRVALPATNVLTKSDLNRHFLQYWRLLRATTRVSNQVVGVDDKFDMDWPKYLEGYRHFSAENGSADQYENFLETVVPRTRVLFDIMRKYIQGALSLHSVVGCLEPFLVYQRDLSFKQYEEIMDFVRDRVAQYKRDYVTYTRSLSAIRPRKMGKVRPALFDDQVFHVLSKEGAESIELRELLENAYNIPAGLLERHDSSEILQRLLAFDNGRYYSTIIAGIVRLGILPSWTMTGLEDVQARLLSGEMATGKKDPCAKYTLSKKYLSLDALDADNGDMAYFDEEYDPTRYTMLSDFAAEQRDMEPLEFETYLAARIAEGAGLSDNDSLREAKAIILGKRVVAAGDYAVLRISDDTVSASQKEKKETPVDLYYKRVGQRWDLDESVAPSTFADESKLFCNLQPGCFQFKSDCVDETTATLEADKGKIDMMVKEFSDQMDWEKQVTFDTIRADIGYYSSIVDALRNVQEKRLWRYNDSQLSLGALAEEGEAVASPRAGLRELILGQSDFVKKQHDIVKFCVRFTRDAEAGEDEYWRYCVAADVKLIPSFMLRLASVFVQNGDYVTALSQTCAQQGTISDDGEAWVDKHSGYVIRTIEFDTEEGYTEAGFKEKTRDQLEEDLGNAVLQAGEADDSKKLSPLAQSVNNIISALAGFMGINIESQRDMIIRNTLVTQKRAMPSEEAYEKAVAAAAQRAARKLPPYQSAHDESLVMLALAYFVVGVQVSVPSVSSKKTHPGCKRSFGGYPLDTDGDDSGITYVACVAHKIKSSVRPWNAIQKKTEVVLVKKIRAVIDKFILPDDAIVEKLGDKRAYLATESDDAVPVAVDVRNWSAFMPPLVPIDLPAPEPVSKAFQSALKANLKNGSMKSSKDIGVLQGKVVDFALAIIQGIGKQVREESALLANAAGDPFLENACCNETMQTPFQYFGGKDNSLFEYNKIVGNTTDLLLDIGTFGRAPLIYDPRNTRLRYPEPTEEFSEDIIYQAFIVFCRYNSNLPVGDKLRAVCLGKPDHPLTGDTLSEQIEMLKRDGHVYSIESLDQLMQVVNTENIVYLGLGDKAEVGIGPLKSVLVELNASEEALPSADSVVARPLLDKLTALTDNFSWTLTEDTPSMRDMKNYLARTTDEMSARLTSFIQRNTKVSAKRAKGLRAFLADITNAGLDPTALFKARRFLDTLLWDATSVYPTMIVQQVDYSESRIPRHWKLSQRHSADVADFIQKHYAPLRPFYKDRGVKRVCEKVANMSSQLELLARHTPFFPSVETAEGPRYASVDARVSYMLSGNYLLTGLMMYVDALEDDALYAASADALTEVSLDEDATGSFTAKAITKGQKSALSQKVGNLLLTYLEMSEKSNAMTSYTYRQVMDKVLRSKEKEKDNITSFLKEMTDEEREVENLFKNNRLERWSKGLQKGLTQYVRETYDEEREELERQAIRERRLGVNSVVTDMNRDIYNLDMMSEDAAAADMEAEENDMTGIADDDDYGENDDGGMLSHDD